MEQNCKRKKIVKVTIVDGNKIIAKNSDVIGISEQNFKRKRHEIDEKDKTHNIIGEKSSEQSQESISKRPKCDEDNYNIENRDENLLDDLKSSITEDNSSLNVIPNEEIASSSKEETCMETHEPKLSNNPRLIKNVNDEIIEVQEGITKKKVILVKKESGTYKVDWNKYFVEQNSILQEKKFPPKKKRKKLEIDPLYEPSTSTQDNTVDIKGPSTSSASNLQIFNKDNYDFSNMPKIPVGRKKKTFYKKEVVKTEPQYTIVEKFQNDDANQIQIKMETAEAKPNKGKGNANKTLVNFFKEQNLTYRVMKRVNFILKMVKQDKVIVDTMKIIKAIREEENKEGYNITIDRKSILRLVLKLSEYGLLTYRKATLKSDTTEKNVSFICDINVDDEHSIITSVLEQSKMKFFIMVNEKEQGKKKKNDIKSNIETKREESSPEPPEIPIETDEKVSYIYNRSLAKKYGYRPKFARCRIIHELLFYIIYDKQIEPINDMLELESIFKEHGGIDQVFEHSNIAPVYNREISWKMFIPPLAPHITWPGGWIILSDILLRLPLFIFTSCFNIAFEIPQLEEYLAHPVRKFFLIKNLPPIIRNGLMYGKKLTYTLIKNLRNLCYLGLIQFGPQKLKEKDHLFIYLNRKASLYNTVASAPGYIHISEDIEYDKIDYIFNNCQDVEQYWYDMWSICINTPLGYRSSVAGEYVIIENTWTKPELNESLKSRSPEEVENFDNGQIPGDKKGAGGLDSSLYSHMKRNWNWINAMPCFNHKNISSEKPKKVKLKQSTKDLTSEESSEEKEIPHDKMKKKEILQSKPKKFKVKPLRTKQKIRHIKPHKTQRKKEYDDKDKVCLAKMRKLRTDWHELEDHVLLLCDVASTYLCPNYRRQRVDQTVFRDILHKMVPYSHDKTSRAVHRRSRYILKNVKTRKSVMTCLEEIKHCEYVTEKFGNLVKKYHNSLIPEETLKIAFTELVGYLNMKFAKQVPKKNNKQINIPDTVNELTEKYLIVPSHKKNLSKFKDPETIYEIESDTVRSVIHSSLCSTKDKTSWAFQLFKIYQQYPETLLRQVINRIRNDKMASMKKCGLLKIKASTTSSILQSPFKLSMNYIYLLQNTKFSFKSLCEGHAFYNNFMHWIHTKNLDDSYDITCSDHGTSLIIENALKELNLEIIFEHPDQVIILDPVLREDKTYERILKKYYDILKAQSGFNLEEDKINSDSDDENVPHIVNEQLLNTDFKNSSRIGFHMMRADMFNCNEKNNVQHMHDYFVVQASKMYIKPIDSNLATTFEKESKKSMHEVINQIKNNIVIPDTYSKIISEDIKSHFSNLKLTTEDLEYVVKIKCAIHDTKEFGLTMDELKNISPDSEKVILSLRNILEILQRLHIVLRVGISCIRFVHFDFKKPWLTHADKILRLEKEKMAKDLIPVKWKGKHILKGDEQKRDRKLKIMVAPWVRLDGSLNRRVLDRWMGTLVSLCVEAPGIKLQDLILHVDFLKPIETMFLIEQLIKINCVRLIKVNKPKTTLFSEVIDYNFEESDILDDPKEVLIEPTEDAFFNFTVFLGSKSYNSNFVD